MSPFPTHEHVSNLAAIQAETNMRLTNARARGGKAEIAWLTSVKEALRDLQQHHAAEAREQARAEAQAKRDAAASPPFTGHDL